MDKKSFFFKTFVAWLPLAAIIIIFSGLVYAAVQQNYRQSANDPQIQIAEDLASAISQGQAPPDAIVPANPTQDLSSTLSAFVAIYTATGTPIGASAALDGKLPSLPSGVFGYAKSRGENRFTWQPKAGVRVAAVLVPFSGPIPGFVLAGRSLREVEVRENQLALMCALAAVLALLLSLLLKFFAKLGEKTSVTEITEIDIISKS